MRLANVRGRAVLVRTDESGVDVATATQGRFGPDLPSVYAAWDGFHTWAAGSDDPADVHFRRSDLGPPSPAPRQVVALGLNYADHAAETGAELPDHLPPTFTKFVSSLTGPEGEVVLPPGGRTDWEVELVLVIGRTATAIDEASAWEHVAGLAVGQDLSERTSQLRGPGPQFSLGKSFAGFAPVGPWLTTADSVPDRDDLRLGCSVDGEVVQDGRTRDLLFPVSTVVSRLSQVITLLPGDLVFTGTPAGVGIARNPPRFLHPGARLRSWIEGLGEIEQHFVAGPHPEQRGTT